jgi:hypothetical protein
LSAAAPLAPAAVFATSASGYVAGSGVGGFTNPVSATGAPDALTGEGLGFPNILSPFSPAFEADEIVGVGRGGSITVTFPVPIRDVPGPDFGVISNVGLIDASYPDGTNTNPAGTFNPLPRAADVEVSADGNNFTPLGRFTLDNPANYFADASNPYLGAVPAGATAADFGKPFGGSLASFNGLNWAQTLTLLNGSGGGTWFDLAGSGLTGGVIAIRFSIPTAGIAGSDDRIFLDAVVAANAAVPEPSWALSGLAVLVGLRARRSVRAVG